MKIIIIILWIRSMGLSIVIYENNLKVYFKLVYDKYMIYCDKWLN